MGKEQDTKERANAQTCRYIQYTSVYTTSLTLPIPIPYMSAEQHISTPTAVFLPTVVRPMSYYDEQPAAADGCFGERSPQSDGKFLVIKPPDIHTRSPPTPTPPPPRIFHTRIILLANLQVGGSCCPSSATPDEFHPNESLQHLVYIQLRQSAAAAG